MIKKKGIWLSRVIFILVGILCFGAGRLSWQYSHHVHLQGFQSAAETNQKVPTVVIEKVERGKILGTVNDASLRIQSGEHFSIPDKDLSFELDITHLGYVGERRQIITVEVPEWARFISSKSGKYYYIVTEKQAQKLSGANHIYFATKEEAEKAGYKFRER